MATKGIWVSAEIMHDKNLTANEKFILAEIYQLSSLEEGCFAHNKHFAELIGSTTRTVTRAIADLQEKGYIKVDVQPGTRNHVREMSTLDKMSNPPRQNVQTPSTKCLETKDNKQINKQINKQESAIIPEWIDVTAWLQWDKYRKEIKKKLTSSTIKKQIQFLEKNKDQHVDIIEQSIQNGWTGLFELDNKISHKQKIKLNSFMDMKKHLEEKYFEIKSIPFEYGDKTWKIGKSGIPYDITTVEDMPFEQRKSFWIYLMNNMNLLEVAI